MSDGVVGVAELLYVLVLAARHETGFVEARTLGESLDLGGGLLRQRTLDFLRIGRQVSSVTTSCVIGRSASLAELRSIGPVAGCEISSSEVTLAP